MNPDAQCRRNMSRRHGVIGRQAALESGLSPRQVERRLASGEWRRTAPSTYVHGVVAETFETRLATAVNWAGPGAFACGASAAYMHGLQGFESASLELATYAGKGLPGVIVHRLRPEDRPELVRLRRIWTSGVERNILDLAGHLSAARVGPALDDALRRRMTDLHRMATILDRDGGRGRRGTRRLRSMLALRDDRDGMTQSELESKMLRILRKTDRPGFRPQFVVTDGDFRAELDFALPSLRLAIETHGYKWHSEFGRWKKDMKRDRRLKLLGWIVLYFSWDEVVLAPGAVLTEIRSAIRWLEGNFSQTTTQEVAN